VATLSLYVLVNKSTKIWLLIQKKKGIAASLRTFSRLNLAPKSEREKKRKIRPADVKKKHKSVSRFLRSFVTFVSVTGCDLLAGDIIDNIQCHTQCIVKSLCDIKD
jgi:hypothetical protein